MVWTDYLLALPITLLALFALGILLLDLLLDKQDKWLNPVLALIGIGFSAGSVYKIQLWVENIGLPPGRGMLGMLGTLYVDRIALYFFYLFLAGAAVNLGGLGLLLPVRSPRISN